MLNKPRLLTPGPTPLPESVRLAMAVDMIHHRKPEFKKIMAESQEKLRLLFGTSQPVIPLSCSGSGAMTAAIDNLFDAGEKVLVIDGGNFAQRWGKIAQVRGLDVITHKLVYGTAVNPADIADILHKNPDIKGVCVQLCETSTGVQHPVRELAAITAGTNALLLVDGISGVGLSPCPMDEWQMDCLLTGSQKGLMLPPGLAFIALSERAWKKAETVKQTNFYFNLPQEKAQVLGNQTSFTPAISLLIGLNKSMELFFETGLENVYRKQWALCCMARAGVQAMGFRLFAPDAPAWGITSVAVPGGMSASALLAEAAKTYNVVMAAGQGDLKEKVIRIGHMGWVDWADLAAGLHALFMSYNTLGGYSGARNYLEDALAAYWQAFNSGYPK